MHGLKSLKNTKNRRRYQSTILGSYQTVELIETFMNYQNQYVMHLPSYAGPTSYSSTYSNPSDSQTAGGYPSSSYTHQTTTWNGSNFANYTTQQYSNYTQDSSGAYAASTAGVTYLHYQ
ncbi:hypothetical protein J1N35_005791 [Gossypium stocksii]|uniref:Uncharacterized protein n=1 Tax=Gossypium stocksii TaxID=47602 RepID=A0A9D4AJL3_9ROSI|nr:hypothetical protein J1N35_005791 [Gossypium stocksii]